MFKKWQAILQFVQETWGLGERGVRRLEHQPRAKTHNRCVFKMGSRCFSKKKRKWLWIVLLIVITIFLISY